MADPDEKPQTASVTPDVEIIKVKRARPSQTPYQKLKLPKLRGGAYYLGLRPEMASDSP